MVSQGELGWGKKGQYWRRSVEKEALQLDSAQCMQQHKVGLLDQYSVKKRLKTKWRLQATPGGCQATITSLIHLLIYIQWSNVKGELLKTMKNGSMEEDQNMLTLKCRPDLSGKVWPQGKGHHLSG